MTNDELFYVIILILSIAIGPLVTYTKHGVIRKILSSSIGILLVLVSCKTDIIHSFISTTITILIIKISNKRYDYLM